MKYTATVNDVHFAFESDVLTLLLAALYRHGKTTKIVSGTIYTDGIAFMHWRGTHWQ